jgi:hypothetical protein
MATSRHLFACSLLSHRLHALRVYCCTAAGSVFTDSVGRHSKRQTLQGSSHKVGRGLAHTPGQHLAVCILLAQRAAGLYTA